MVERLVLVSPIVNGLAFSEHFLARNRVNNKPLAQGNLAATIQNWASDRFLMAPQNTQVRAQFVELLQANPHNLTHSFSFNESPRLASLSQLKEVQVPTLLVTGEADIADVHAWALQAGIRQARRVVLAQVGHLLYLEQPLVFDQLLTQFITN